jgi:prepilin-type N-terminal cleavage/methylation domain-containing protein
MPRRAFTLVELLVVIAIIGLLSSIAVVSMNGAREKARIAAGQSFEQSIYQKLGDRLEGEWKFETLGATTPDSSGFGRTGTVTNGTQVVGISGNALSLIGTGTVNVGSIDIPTDVTVSAWIKPTTQCQNGFIVSKSPQNSSWELFIEGCTIKWRGGASVDNDVYCAPPSASVWHHVVGTQSGTTARIYVDGHPCITGTEPAINNGAGAVLIGELGGAYYFNGLIDEVRVYSGSLLEP